MPELTIQTLGQTQVRRGGRDLKWGAQSARELFFYLLSYPEGRSKAQIFEDLWQEDVDAASNNRFRVTLHRVRTALDSSEAISEQAGRYQLSPEVLRASDVYALYGAMHDAERAGDPLHKREALRRVTTLYGGDYLPDEGAEWVLTAREEHKAAYVQANLELSLLHCDGHACDLSVQALVQALRADPYVGEQYHQKLMTCLSVVEGKYAAIEHYRRFLKFLHDDLNDTVMPDTQDLAERIKAGEPICARDDGTLEELPMARLCPLTPDGHCPGALEALMPHEAAPGAAALK